MMRGQEDLLSEQGGGSGEVSFAPFPEDSGEAEEELSPLEDTETRGHPGFVCITKESGDQVWLQTALKNVRVSSESPLWPVPLWRRKVRSIKAHCRVWDEKEPNFRSSPLTGWRLAYVELPLMIVDPQNESALVCGRELGGRLPELWELSLHPLVGLVRVSEHPGGFRHYQIEDSPFALIFDDEQEGSPRDLPSSSA